VILSRLDLDGVWLAQRPCGGRRCRGR